MRMTTLRQPAPDLSEELARCVELISDFEPTQEWTRRSEAWTLDVYLTLWAWNPRRAERFMRTSLFESSGGEFMLNDLANEHLLRDELCRRRRRLESMTTRNWKRISMFSELLAP